MPEYYDLVVVGTGFASSFFPRAFLEHVTPSTRVEQVVTHLLLSTGLLGHGSVGERTVRYEVFYDPRRTVCRNLLTSLEPADA